MRQHALALGVGQGQVGGRHLDEDRVEQAFGRATDGRLGSGRVLEGEVVLEVTFVATGQLRIVRVVGSLGHGKVFRSD